MTKTLRVDLADLEGIPHASGPSGTSVVVTAEYTSPVILAADGTIILSPKSKTMGASGRVDFDGIYASDSEDVREDHRGFAVRVKVEIREPNGATRTWSRTVKPLENMTATINLGQLPSAEGLPPQWVSADDYVEAVVAAAAEGVAAMDRVVRDDITGRLYFDRAPTAPVLVDNFNRPDESPVTPTPVGAVPLVPGPSTTLSVVGHRLAMHGTVTRTGFWNAGQADGVFRITVANTGWNGTNHAFGVLFRSSGADWQNALILRGAVSGALTNYAIQARSGGAYGAYLSGVTAYPATAGDQIEVTMSGAQVTVKVNGTTIYSGAPSGFATGTHIGVFNLASRDDVRFDDVSFEQIGA